MPFRKLLSPRYIRVVCTALRHGSYDVLQDLTCCSAAAKVCGGRWQHALHLLKAELYHGV